MVSDLSEQNTINKNKMDSHLFCQSLVASESLSVNNVSPVYLKCNMYGVVKFPPVLPVVGSE